MRFRTLCVKTHNSDDLQVADTSPPPPHLVAKRHFKDENEDDGKDDECDGLAEKHFKRRVSNYSATPRSLHISTMIIFTLLMYKMQLHFVNKFIFMKLCNIILHLTKNYLTLNVK